MSFDTLTINNLLIAVFLAWHYALFCGYISDDHSAVACRKDIIPDDEKKDRKESFWVKRFNDGLVMFYINNLFWKLGLKNMPFFWHLFSLLLHVANTYLLYIFLIPIVGERIAFYSCAFWAVNPMLNQNVVWISGRPYVIGLFLSLIALICWQSPVVFIPFYALAVVTNISILFVPILNFIIHPHEWQSKVYLLSMLFMAFPFLAWKFHKRFQTGALVIDRDNFKLKIRKINTFVRVALYYIWTLFVPVRMGWYHQAGFKYNERWEKFNYITLLSFIVVGLLIFYFKLPGWIFMLGFIPNSNFLATNSFVQDRYLYFCSIGIAMIVAPYLAQYEPLFWCAMTFYITRAYMYSRHLKNDEKLYRENWRNHPKSDYAINNLAYFLIQQRRYDESRVVIERGLSVERMNKMLWYNLAITYAAQGHFGSDEGKFKFIKALDSWKMCLQIEPRWSKPAEDIKKLVGLLVQNKVITLDKSEAAPHGMTISVPNIIGMKEMISGSSSNANSAEQTAQTVPAQTVPAA